MHDGAEPSHAAHASTSRPPAQGTPTSSSQAVFRAPHTPEEGHDVRYNFGLGLLSLYT